jgi:hypothetical protein
MALAGFEMSEEEKIRSLLLDFLNDAASKLSIQMLVAETQNVATLARRPARTRPFLDRKADHA